MPSGTYSHERQKGVGFKIKLHHEGTLVKLGYRLEEPAKKRRPALKKAVRVYGYKRTADKLIALQVLNKNHNPEFSETARKDREFLKVHRAGASAIRR